MSNHGGGIGGGNSSNGFRNYDELNYPDLISASIQTCNGSQLPILQDILNRQRQQQPPPPQPPHASSASGNNNLKLPPMPPPLSSTILQRIEDDLKKMSSSSSMSPFTTFEVEREILARNTERQLKISAMSSSEQNNLNNNNDDGDDGGSKLNKTYTGPVDAPAAHEVDETGCPASSCGEFLSWGNDRKKW